MRTARADQPRFRVHARGLWDDRVAALPGSFWKPTERSECQWLRFSDAAEFGLEWRVGSVHDAGRPVRRAIGRVQLDQVESEFHGSVIRSSWTRTWLRGR